MIEVLASVTIFALVILGMAVGVLRGRAAITGSCGGLNNIPGVESDCGGACRTGAKVCPRKAAAEAAAKPGS